MRVTSLLVVGTLVFGPAASAAAHAAAMTMTMAPATGPASEGDLDEVGQAARHFKLGVKLYQAGDFPGALVEFRAANALVPNYKILYNLGQVAHEMHDWNSALRYYREYLDSGGKAIRDDRRQEVEATIAELSPKVGRLRIKLVGGPAEVRLNGYLTPPEALDEAIALNPGQHEVTAVFPGEESVSRTATLNGGDNIELVFRRPTPPPKPAAPPPVAAAVPQKPWLLRQPAAVWTWTGTGLLAAGAIVSGLRARGYSQDLVREREQFPAAPDRLEWFQSRTRRYALITDGLVAGGTVLALVSLYLSFRDQDQRPGETAQIPETLGLQVGPGGMAYGWKF